MPLGYAGRTNRLAAERRLIVKPSDRLHSTGLSAQDWVSALEAAQQSLRQMGLHDVLSLPPDRLVDGLRAWRGSR